MEVGKDAATEGSPQGVRPATEAVGAPVRPRAQYPLSTEQVEKYWKIMGELKACSPLLQLHLKRAIELAAKEGPGSSAEKYMRLLRDMTEQCRMGRSSPEMTKYPITTASLRIASCMYNHLKNASSSTRSTAGVTPGVVPRPISSNSLEAGAQATKRAQPEQQQVQLGPGVGGAGGAEGGAGPSGLVDADLAQRCVEDTDGERPGKLPRLASGNKEAQDRANQGPLVAGEVVSAAPDPMDEAEEEISVVSNMLLSALTSTKGALEQVQARAAAAEAKVAEAEKQLQAERVRGEAAEAKAAEAEARAAAAEAKVAAAEGQLQAERARGEAAEAKVAEAEARAAAAEAKVAEAEGQLQAERARGEAADAKAAEAEARAAVANAKMAEAEGQLQAGRARFHRVRALMASMRQQAGITREREGAATAAAQP